MKINILKNQAGHRKRLREKFTRSGISGFHDYEIIELLLTLGTPRKDCKQQAKEAIVKFKTLRGVLEAPVEDLQEIKGIGPHNIFGIKLVQEVARKFLKEKILEKPICKSSKEIFDYLYHSMRDLKKEAFKVIFLDGKNQIIEIEDLFEGTLNTSSIYPREVIKSAIKNNPVNTLKLLIDLDILETMFPNIRNLTLNKRIFSSETIFQKIESKYEYLVDRKVSDMSVYFAVLLMETYVDEEKNKRRESILKLKLDKQLRFYKFSNKQRENILFLIENRNSLMNLVGSEPSKLELRQLIKKLGVHMKSITYLTESELSVKIPELDFTPLKNALDEIKQNHDLINFQLQIDGYEIQTIFGIKGKKIKQLKSDDDSLSLTISESTKILNNIHNQLMEKVMVI